MSIWDLLPGVGELAETGIDYFTTQNLLKNKKRQVKGMDYSKTPEGQELLTESQQGDITPAQRRAIMTRTGIESGAATSMGKAAYAGRLRAQGIDSSLAGQRGLNQFDIANAQTLGNTSGQLDIENAQSMAEARRRYASGAQAYSAQRRAQLDALDEANQQNNVKGIQGLFRAGASIIPGIKSLFPSNKSTSNLGVKASPLLNTQPGPVLPGSGAPSILDLGKIGKNYLFKTSDHDTFLQTMMQQYPENKWGDMEWEWFQAQKKKNKGAQ